jgi:hypothetical protein
MASLMHIILDEQRNFRYGYRKVPPVHKVISCRSLEHKIPEIITKTFTSTIKFYAYKINLEHETDILKSFVTSSLLGSNTFLSVLFWNTFKVSSFTVKNKVHTHVK